MAEEARLESVCTPKGYREFESRSLRKSLDVAQLVAHLVRDQEVAGSSPVIQTRGASGLLFSCLDDHHSLRGRPSQVLAINVAGL